MNMINDKKIAFLKTTVMHFLELDIPIFIFINTLILNE